MAVFFGALVLRVQTIEDLVASEVAGPSMVAQLLGSFAVLALIRVSLRIYGVLAMLVRQRTPEIGVRMALGARRADILKSVMTRGARLVCAGLGLEPAAWILPRLIRSLLYDINAADPAAFAGCSVLFLA